MEKEKSIETYLNALRKINEQLKKDDIRMDDALELYERGATLAREAYDILNGYREKIDAIEAGAMQTHD